MTLIFIGLIVSTNIYIVFHDIRNRKISNNIIVLISLIGFFSIFVKGDIDFLISPLIILFFGFILFKFNVIAAGDIKLFSAMSLMINKEYILLITIIILFIGGLQAYCQYSMYKLTNNREWIDRGVPYGVAISIGSLFGILASM
ncbi:prepilin peptidase [Aliivibrio sp. EL58]|uniref:A24 family peptidase n=1 Tax=Aliivibrio sp. EL58 TaxID=2107582 RepID=UPI0020B161D9|nr:prepilin peptidase [Aliivibrio sp. EL58]